MRNIARDVVGGEEAAVGEARHARAVACSAEACVPFRGGEEVRLGKDRLKLAMCSLQRELYGLSLRVGTEEISLSLIHI